MARINHYSSLDVIENLLSDAKEKGAMHLKTSIGKPVGRTLFVENKELINFGTCSYLGLDIDPRVIESSVEYVRRYGLQMPISRAYASSEVTESLEEKLSKIYNRPVVVYPSTSKAHISVVPTVVGSNDVAILDQQVHISVQTAVQLLRQKGTPIDMIRHSNLEMLERKLQDLKNKCEKVWYFVDGVYSMYGDSAPINKLKELLVAYPELHIYIDDAHGMSWDGKHGGGYFVSQTELHDRMILMTTMGKGFGAIGGIAILPNKETHWNVRVWGGPLTYSHPHSPAILGAAHASADIHLSDEIYVFQKQIQERIAYCHSLLVNKNLPLLSEAKIPIKYIGAGQPKTGYKLIKGVIDDGFFVNIGIFPGVPIKNTGMRFTVSRHVEFEDIENIVDSIERNYYKALESEKTSDDAVRKAFRLPSIQNEKQDEFCCQVYTSYKQIQKDEWDATIGVQGNFNYDSLQVFEQAYTNNSKQEDNLSFFYVLKKDNAGKILAATFMSLGMQKDDFLAKSEVSVKIEEVRKSDKYHLCSKTLSTGCMLSLGEHIYIDKTQKDWKQNFSDLLHDIDLLRQKNDVNNVILRDFSIEDDDLNKFLINQGFVQVEMPYSNTVSLSNWNSHEEFYSQLSKKSKRHFKSDIEKTLDLFTVEIRDSLTEVEMDIAYELFMNVSQKNFALNIFPYPKSTLAAINESENWEYILLYDKSKSDKFVACVMCSKAINANYPIFMGIDYSTENNPYRQALFQMIMRAKKLGYNFIELGLSAHIEKKKLGAVQNKICMYSQVIDNYNMDVISTMGGN